MIFVWALYEVCMRFVCNLYEIWALYEFWIFWWVQHSTLPPTFLERQSIGDCMFQVFPVLWHLCVLESMLWMHIVHAPPLSWHFLKPTGFLLDRRFKDTWTIELLITKPSRYFSDYAVVNQLWIITKSLTIIWIRGLLWRQLKMFNVISFLLGCPQLFEKHQDWKEQSGSKDNHCDPELS